VADPVRGVRRTRADLVARAVVSGGSGHRAEASATTFSGERRPVQRRSVSSVDERVRDEAETESILGDALLMEAIREGLADAEAGGRTFSHEEVVEALRRRSATEKVDDLDDPGRSRAGVTRRRARPPRQRP